jgi:SAM-dependent methyltransferase
MTVICCRWSVERVQQLCERLTAQHVRLILVQDSPGQAKPLAGELPVSTFRWSPELDLAGIQKLTLRQAISDGANAVLVANAAATPEVVDDLIRDFREHPVDLLGVRVPSSLPGWLQSQMQRCTGERSIDLPLVARVLSRRLLCSVPFEINAGGDRFDLELVLQARRIGAAIRFVDRSDLNSQVDLPVIQIVRGLLRYRCHSVGMLCSLRFRCIGSSNYVDKSEMLYTSHTLAMREVERLAPQSVLDIGCGSGHVARRCRKMGATVTGLDFFEPSLDDALDSFHQLNLDDVELPVDPGAFDTVLMLDVIEHLMDPEEFLLNLRHRCESSSSDNQPVLVLSTPNVAFIGVRLGLLFGRFNYADRGILDVTHRRLFTRGSLLWSLKSCGYDVDRVIPVPVPFETVMGGRGRLPATLAALAAKLLPRLFAFQWLVVCRPHSGLRQLEIS